MIKAAIDIGSNAVRLLIAALEKDANGAVHLNKHQLVRLPIRLGEDVFKKGRIETLLQCKLVEGILALKKIALLYQVESLRCTATSALREAENKEEVVLLVKQLTGVEIEIIDGALEAEIILDGIQKVMPQEVTEFVHVDVGGGSTEINYLKNGKLKASKSFKIGSVRLLNEQVDPKEWDELYTFLEALKKRNITYGAGTGGNINKLLKLRGDKNQKEMQREELNELIAELDQLNIEERISKFQLKPDRADVIVFAGNIYNEIFKFLGTSKIFVPKVGLADGIILTEK